MYVHTLTGRGLLLLIWNSRQCESLSEQIKLKWVYALFCWDESNNQFMKMNNIYYRPIWTCGRFDEQTQSAIYFNLIEGLSYFFENYSALVIGGILAISRGEKIDIKSISTKTGIALNSLYPFFQQLEELGLISSNPIDTTLIKTYRQLVHKKKNHSIEIKTDSKEPFTFSNAERSYANRCKGKTTTIMFELTYNCSEQCIHCYNPGATRNESEKSYRNQKIELQIDDYKRIIDELYEEGLVRVCLSGGDPFSKDIVWEIIDYLFQKEIAIEIYTNGQRLNNYVDKLASYFPCAVGVSIYSSVPEKHDAITRIPGSFNKSIRTIEQLYEHAIPIEIKCCIMQTNLKTYIGVADIAAKYNATLQIESAIFDSADGDKCVSNFLRLNPKQMELVLRDKNNPLYIGPELDNYGARKLDMEDNGCKAGFKAFCITPDGNLTPCCSFYASLGNLKEQSLNDILANSPFLNWWNILTLNQYEECGKHEYCDYCKLCPGLNYNEHGTPIKAGENNCYIAKIRHNLATRMKNGYDPLNGKQIQEVLEELPEINVSPLHRIIQMNKGDNLKG